MYYKVMLRIKNFSWPSLFIGAGSGFIVGALILGLIVNYLISGALSGASTNGKFLGGNIDQVRAGIAQANAEKAATSVYGHVVSIGNGTLVLEVAQSTGKKQFTFVYDDNTKFVYLANDAASTQMPLSTGEITIGTALTIETNEPVGSVANQHAVKATRL